MNLLTNKPLQHSVHHRYLALDGLRGLAIVMILVFHCAQVSPLIAKVPFAKSCWLGVDLFFVLSGFLITGILHDSRHNKHYFTYFYVRRTLRIMPLYYSYLFIVLIIIPYARPSLLTNVHEMVKNQWWYWSYLPNWLFSFGSMPKNEGICISLWSLAIEEQFYLVWPIIIYYTSVSNSVKLMLALMLFCGLFRNFAHFLPLGLNSRYNYFATFSRMDAILCGSIIATAWRYYKEILKKAVFPIILSAFAVLIAVAFTFYPDFYSAFIDFSTLFDLIFGGMVIYAITSKENLMKKILTSKALIFMGKYSYGIYIFNLITLRTLEEKFTMFFLAHRTDALLHDLLLPIAGVSLSIGLAMASYNLIELPFLDLKRYFIEKNYKSSLNEKPAF